MKAYAVIWSERALAQLEKLDATVRRRIRAKVLQVATNPERYSVRLVNSSYRRIRVGDWRVIIRVDKGAIQVIVIEVQHRSTPYRR